MATVYIPSLLRPLTRGQAKVGVPGSTVSEIISNMDAEYPGVSDRLMEDGRIRPSISVAVDGELAPLGLLEKVGPESEVHFLPAMSGGAGVSSLGPGCAAARAVR